MLLTLSPDSEDWLPVGYLMTESCLHLMLFGTNGNYRLWRKNQLFFPPPFFFFFVVVDKALLCAGTDLWKNKLFSEQENRQCLVLLQIYPFSTQVQKSCLHFCHSSTSPWNSGKNLLSSTNHLVKLFLFHFKLKELKWSDTNYRQSFPSVTSFPFEKNRE